MYRIAIVLLCVALLAGCDRNGTNVRKTEPSPESSTSTTLKPIESFNRASWAKLASSPKAHDAAEVSIVGQVTIPPQGQSRDVSWMMLADPQNNRWPVTVHALREVAGDIRSKDYVSVQGVVSGDSEFGHKDSDGIAQVPVTVLASEVTLVDETAIGPPGVVVRKASKAKTQRGVTIKIRKVEFAKDETRVHIVIFNNSKSRAYFYPQQAKLIQNGSEHTGRDSADGPQVPSDSNPGERIQGVVIFDSLKPTAPTRISFDMLWEDVYSEFETYRFKLKNISSGP